MRDALGSVQSVLLLGGGSDIGLAVMRRLIADRTRLVVLAARRPEQLRSQVRDLEMAGATVKAVPFDADDVDSHHRFVDEVFDTYGDIDAAVLAFGLLGHDDQFDRAQAISLLRTNTVGAVSVLLAVVERFRNQGHGTVVVLSSVAGERVRKSNFAYGASKAGLDGFCQGLGDALVGSGVDVMVVRPGFVDTKMTAELERAPFSTTPDEVADAVLLGIRRRSQIVWVPPTLRWVMAVARHLPRPAFRRLPF